jgi:hypothetical protein
MLRVLAAVTALLLAGCATVVPTPKVAAVPSPQSALDAYARVLERSVNDAGEVDFTALAGDPADLERYVAFIAATPLTAFAPGAPRLAHTINSYNALSMYNVITSGIPKTHAGFAKVRFFVLREFDIGGERRSLYSYENDVIRPLDEPRVHFALNCSAVSCPVLPRRPFSAQDLDTELERETRAFFARPQNFRVDHAARSVYVSEILDFYTEDFVPHHAPSLIAYVNRYVAQPAPEDYAVRFIPYDWTIANSRRSQ